MKFIICLGFVFFSHFIFSADAIFENSYVTASMDSKVNKFISMEIALSLKQSIEEYNKLRTSPEKMKSKMVSNEENEMFLSLLSDQGNLPEIVYHQESGYYQLNFGSQKIEFNTGLLLSKSFYLNKQLINFKNHKDLKANFVKVSWYNFFIDNAYAGFVENTNANRILFASIISLDNIFEDAGMICTIKCDTLKINISKLSQKIESYNNDCLNAVNEQKTSFESAQNINYYSTVKVLGDSMFTEGESVDKLLIKMGQIKNKEVNNKLDAKFRNDFVADTCEKQMSPMISSGIMNLRAYGLSDNSQVSTVSIPTMCGKITSLKQCLNDLYTSNKSISQTLKNKGLNIVSDDHFSNLESATTIGK